MKNRVREYREKKYLTQQELAYQIDMNVQTVLSVENGKHRPRKSTMRKLAKHLDASIEDLFPEPVQSNYAA